MSPSHKSRVVTRYHFDVRLDELRAGHEASNVPWAATPGVFTLPVEIGQ